MITCPVNSWCRSSFLRHFLRVSKSTSELRPYHNSNLQFLTLRRNFSRTATSEMRFIQYKRKNDSNLRLGVISEDGATVTEITGAPSNNMIDLISANLSMDEVSKKIQGSKGETGVELLQPVTNPEKIVCIGLNYAGHCKEQNKEPPKNPMFFSKFASSLVGPNGNVIAHSITNKIDWEIELAVVIGKEAKKVPKDKAYDYIFGYSVAQDISARDWQKELNGGQFLIGKTMDSFCPLGPIVHKSLVKDPHNLQLTCKVNGVLKQSGNTNELVFRIDDIISRLSQAITLKPGDIILTGTPAGVGMHRNPPEFLKPGDVIESEIEGLGKLVNKVVAG